MCAIQQCPVHSQFCVMMAAFFIHNFPSSKLKLCSKSTSSLFSSAQARAKAIFVSACVHSPSSPHVNGAIWYLFLSGWLISLSRVSSIFTHAMACVRISFFFSVNNIPVRLGHVLSICVFGFFFHMSSFVNNAIMNTNWFVHTCWSFQSFNFFLNQF